VHSIRLLRPLPERRSARGKCAKRALCQHFLSFGDLPEIPIMMSAGRIIVIASVHNHRQPDNGRRSFTGRAIQWTFGCHFALASPSAAARGPHRVTRVGSLPQRGHGGWLMLAPRRRGHIPIVKKAKHLRPVETRDWLARGVRIPLLSAARIGRSPRPGCRTQVCRSPAARKPLTFA